jgi:putative Mn2+ efflux pump MntP
VLQVVLLALILAVNNFFGAVSLGAAELGPRDKLRVVLAFGLADCAVPLVGVVLGSGLAELLGPPARYAGAALILLTAAYMFLQGRHRAPATQGLSVGALWLTAVALSLDNLGAGLGLGAMGYPLPAVLLLFGTITAGMTVVGLALGRVLYRHLGARNASGVSGVLLFATGCAMLASRLHSG